MAQGIKNHIFFFVAGNYNHWKGCEIVLLNVHTCFKSSTPFVSGNVINKNAIKIIVFTYQSKTLLVHPWLDEHLHYNEVFGSYFLKRS